MISKYFLFITAAALFTGCTTEKGEVPESLPCDTSMITYTNTIERIVSTNCTTAPGCHLRGASEGDMTSYQGLMLKVNSQALKQRVLIDKTMPPTGPLSIEDRQKIQCWLNEGAPEN